MFCVEVKTRKGVLWAKMYIVQAAGYPLTTKWQLVRLYKNVQNVKYFSCHRR